MINFAAIAGGLSWIGIALMIIGGLAALTYQLAVNDLTHASEKWILNRRYFAGSTATVFVGAALHLTSLAVAPSTLTFEQFMSRCSPALRLQGEIALKLNHERHERCIAIAEKRGMI